MSDAPIVGVILAAGLSRRLGRPKQLELIDGRPLVAWVVECALASSLDRIAVVTGHTADEVNAAVSPFSVVPLHNSDYSTGQASSLVKGIDWAQGLGADAVVVMLADQPGVLSTSIDSLINARRNHLALLAMTRYGSERSHPVMFGRELFPELQDLAGDTGGRELIQRYGSELVLVDGDRDTIPADLDTDADLDSVVTDARNAH